MPCLKGVSSGDVASLAAGSACPDSEVTDLDLTKPDWVQTGSKSPPHGFPEPGARPQTGTNNIRPLLKNQAEVTAEPARRLRTYADYLAELERPTSHSSHSFAKPLDCGRAVCPPLGPDPELRGLLLWRRRAYTRTTEALNQRLSPLPSWVSATRLQQKAESVS